MSEFKYAGNTLKVVVRDDSTQLIGNNRSKYRTIDIALTEEQIEQLKLYKTESGIWEDVSICFFETVDIPAEEPEETGETGEGEEPEETGDGEESEGEELEVEEFDGEEAEGEE